ncbi:3(or 17)beta-hydroxysteroid dehydrogenase [Oryzisolibacter propanilivorax]|uniref:3(Or 17)beta-hydroxysteroid dehydrogenase n=1 Tax=Oryzisolibacter propanilivorax TaxID=1527607 RepID=A0A1G9NYA5_9BURK|nr:SDR family oxidoreductase [Oryzisolibacter propanilivorax]SDL91558.1 3(or 17)beta-hydroxysteroid dehydrogenase [Oryzisolibacter propanilivorax]
MGECVQDKVAIVTGAASGVGLAVAQALLAAGARVALTDVNEDAGRQAVAELGERALFVRHDVTSDAGWTQVMDTVQGHWGAPQVLVNNAGILLLGDLETGTLQDFQRLLQVNTESVFLGCQHGIRAMKAGGGSIVNIASVASWLPIEQYAGYSASKAAVAALTRSAALLCRNKGYPVRVNSVHPDGIYTPMMQATLPAGVTREMVLHHPQRNPKGRAYLPEQIAQLVLFLASDASSVMSGSELRADNAILGTGL